MGTHAAGGIDWTPINYRAEIADRLAAHSTVTIWRSLAPFLPSGGAILEIGCGSGRIITLACRHKGARGVGLDVTASGMRYAQTLAAFVGVSPGFVQGDGLMLPFANDTFDCVFSEGVINHFGAKIPAIVAEHARVCRPGGRVIITAPNILHVLHTYHRLRAGPAFVGHRERAFTRPGLARLLRHAGLQPSAYSGFSPSAPFEWFLPGHPTWSRPLDLRLGPTLLSWLGYQTVCIAVKT